VPVDPDEDRVHPEADRPRLLRSGDQELPQPDQVTNTSRINKVGFVWLGSFGFSFIFSSLLVLSHTSASRSRRDVKNPPSWQKVLCGQSECLNIASGKEIVLN
jgi:hypothetical protein